MKILVVDDSEFARQRLANVLRGHGHEVVEADSGDKALELLNDSGAEAVTIDLLMPGMDGLELLRRLRAQRPLLPLIVVSADVQQATHREVLAAGADAFVAKTVLDTIHAELLQAAARSKPQPTLSAAQKDAITELMNLAIGQVAHAISTLLSRRVVLRVPEVELMNAAQLTTFFQEELVDVGVTTQQRFSGGLSGSVALVFSLPHAQRLVKALVGSPLQLSTLSQAERSALIELANIVLNAAIAVLADQCGERLRVSLPELIINQAGEVAAKDLLCNAGEDKDALVLVNHLTISDTELIGYLILLLSSKETRHLLDRILPEN